MLTQKMIDGKEETKEKEKKFFDFLFKSPSINSAQASSHIKPGYLHKFIDCNCYWCGLSYFRKLFTKI